MFGLKKSQGGASRPVIEYPIPAKIPKRIKWVRRLVVLAGLSSFLSFATAFTVIESMIGELSKVEADARAAAQGMPASKDNPIVVGADVLTIARNFSLTLSGVLSIVFLYLPFRYFQLFRRIPKGHPNTYTSIRDVSIIQIVVEMIKVTTFEATNLETAVVDLPTAASPALFLSVGVLLLVTRAKSKAFFYRPRLVAVKQGGATSVSDERAMRNGKHERSTAIAKTSPPGENGGV